MKRTGVIVAIFMLFTSFCTLITNAGCGKEKEKITSYTIECEYKGNELTGKERVEFYNFTDNSFKELKFNLFGNAFREDAKFSPIAKQYQSRAYIGGKNYGGMEITSVSDPVSGEVLQYIIEGEDKNILSVELPAEVFPDESVSVDIEYKLKLASVIARTGINGNTVNLANFYPILCGIEDGAFYECLYYQNGDPFFSDCANYTVKLTADSEFVVASSGKLTDSIYAGEKTVSTYKINRARSFAFVLSENFESITDDSTGVAITYYYYDDDNPTESVKAAVDAIKCFNATFGNYPYETYSVAQTAFIQGGMEFPALVYISDELTREENTEVIVHETAHQWWQTGVGNNEIKYGFLDEGLAEYSVIVFYEKNTDYKVKKEDLIKSAETTYKTFCSVYDKVFGKVDTSMTRDLSEYSSEYEYVNIAYIKPCIMYDCLRKTIGDDKFYKGLKTYYADYLYLNAVPDDLIASYEKAGVSVDGFFDGFLNGKAII